MSCARCPCTSRRFWLKIRKSCNLHVDLFQEPSPSGIWLKYELFGFLVWEQAEHWKYHKLIIQNTIVQTDKQDARKWYVEMFAEFLVCVGCACLSDAMQWSQNDSVERRRNYWKTWFSGDLFYVNSLCLNPSILERFPTPGSPLCLFSWQIVLIFYGPFDVIYWITISHWNVESRCVSQTEGVH